LRSGTGVPWSKRIRISAPEWGLPSFERRTRGDLTDLLYQAEC
jgi:hypothetical protein